MLISTSDLEIDVLDANPHGRRPIVVVHGYPDHVTSWEPVIERWVADGHRVVAPTLRGFGSTSFRSETTPRDATLDVLVRDLLDVVDTLGIERATLVGQDWGARIVQGVAAVQPERVERLLSLGGYGLAWPEDQSYAQLERIWYQLALNLPLGESILRYDAEGFARHLWRTWSPTWDDWERVFDRARPALDNPDHAEIVLSAYSWGDEGSELGELLAGGPPIEVPTTIVLGADDGIESDPLDASWDEAHVPGLRSRRILDGVGHFPHAEAPELVARLAR